MPKGDFLNTIDPREFGRLEAQVEALQQEVHALRSDIKELLEMASRGKGAMWAGMTIASAVGAVGGYIVDKLSR